MKERDVDSHSLEEKVVREHAQLEPLFEATRGALTQGEKGEALDAIARLREETNSHTAHEDKLYYPALWSLCPQHKSALEHFIRSHEHFRTDLDQIIRCIVADDLSGAAALFDEFSMSFATHEVYEEELLRKIDEESPWGAPSPVSSGA